MFTTSIKFKNFLTKKKYFNIKKKLKLVLNEKNQVIRSLSKTYKDNFNNAQNFLTKLGNPYEAILLDENGTISIEWGAYGVPETFLIYKNKIITKYIGPLNEELINEINSIVK